MRRQLLIATRPVAASQHVEPVPVSWACAVAQTPWCPHLACRPLHINKPPSRSRQQHQGARWPVTVRVSSLCLPGSLLLIERETSPFCRCASQHRREARLVVNPRIQSIEVSGGTFQALDRPKSIQRHTDAATNDAGPGRASPRGPWGARGQRREAPAGNILARH